MPYFTGAFRIPNMYNGYPLIDEAEGIFVKGDTAATSWAPQRGTDSTIKRISIDTRRQFARTANEVRVGSAGAGIYIAY
jgi:hypothetical protein